MTPNDTGSATPKRVLVIGGGIAGLTAAVESAEAGCEVVLVEKSASLGGRVARTNLYFPKLCPPACGLEINTRRVKNNPRISVLTQAEVRSITGEPGAFQVTVEIAPRYVTDACTVCGECEKVCPADQPDDFNYGLSRAKAIHLPFAFAVPARYVVNRAACPAGCDLCVKACPANAVDLAMKPETRVVTVSAIVAATGWAPYDATRIDNLGYGRVTNVVTNAIMERLASPGGPTGGKITRPSDGAVPATVAFVQCAGSRDQNHLPYCSAVCCAASLKQATYVRTACPEATVKIFYIDVRTPGRLEEFYTRVAADPAIELIKGKVARVDEDPATKDVVIEVEDTRTGRKLREQVGLLVLATGIVPQTEGLPDAFRRDRFGFLAGASSRTGFYSAGCVHRPEEVSGSVQDATGAALRALQCAVRSARHG